jgi:predicted branched-subunit amino acid permease
MRSVVGIPVGVLQPGIAEEAWGRAFMLVFLLLVFSRSAVARVALRTALVVSVLWFAWLHLPLNPVATALLGVLFVLPMAILWLQRDLESAIGFHVASDFVRFAASNLFVHGLWFA